MGPVNTGRADPGAVSEPSTDRGRRPKRSTRSSGWSSSPACPAPAAPPRRTRWRISAGTWSTTSRRACCRMSARRRSDAGITRLAVVLDVRTRSFFEQLPTMFADLTGRGMLPEILFLEAADDVIVRRQESVRRPHPLQGDGRLLDGIAASGQTAGHPARRRRPGDRHLLDQRAPAQLPGLPRLRRRHHDKLRVTLVSFGFKNGIPVDADLVVDVRFLPNPHWVPELRPQTGLSTAGQRLRARRQHGAERVPGPADRAAADDGRAATSARANGSPRSRSAAPAASTAAPR